MSREKDPAFLFYSKDWLEGTADMSKEAKGVFIDLLAHQHQKGGLPMDIKKLARLASMSEIEFVVIWEAEVKDKFKPIGNHDSNRLVNQKLTKVLTERSERGHRNKITGTLASIIRLSPAPYEIKQKAKQGFKIDDFLTIPDQNLTDRLTEWFLSRLKSIEDANEDANANENKDRGMGEGISFSMIHAFKSSFPDYAVDNRIDLPACTEIANKIADAKGWPRAHITAERKMDVLAEWDRLVLFARADKWYSTRAIADLNKEFQRLTQSANNGKGSKTHFGSPIGGIPAKQDPQRIDKEGSGSGF